MAKLFETVPMPDEYTAFLAERGLSEADVLPMLVNRSELFQNPDFYRDLAGLFKSAHTATADELKQFEHILEALLPERNANWLIRKISSDLVNALRAANVSIPEGILAIGVFPLGSFNARAVPRDRGAIILLDTGCMEILEFCCALSACFQETRVASFGNELSNGLVKYCDTGDFPSIWGTLPESEWKAHGSLATYTTSWAEWFVMAHEYGHYALGHLRKAQRQFHSSGFGNIPVTEYAHALEYEADIWGIWALLKAAKTTAPDDEFPRAFACAAPFFFLSALALLECIWAKRGHVNKSHPPAIYRIINLEICLGRWGLLDDNCFIWTHFNKIADFASCSLSGHKLVDSVINEELVRALSLSSWQVQVRLPL